MHGKQVCALGCGVGLLLEDTVSTSKLLSWPSKAGSGCQQPSPGRFLLLWHAQIARSCPSQQLALELFLGLSWPDRNGDSE